MTTSRGSAWCVLAAAVLAAWVSPAAGAADVPAAAPADTACINLLDREDMIFSGLLRNRIFPGPPNFKDVRRGDAPEPTYILELDEDACAKGDGTVPEGTRFATVHLYSANEESSVWADLRSLVGRRVRVEGAAAFGAQTGHHHAPVVMAVMSVAPEPEAGPPAAAEGTTSAIEPGGGARTTVEAFYAALAAGNGEEAARLVVPEKRASGPFSAREITRFYGALAEPLRPLAVTPIGAGRYRVRYTFVAGGGARCNGEAVVSTTRVGELNLIAGIRALRGC